MINNTVYQEVGDAIRIQGSSQNVRLRNNILWVDAGYDLYVASDSQVGFNSDYNNLHTTGSGKLARWQLGDGSFRDFSTQVDWFYELGQDGHSQTADPLFVDRDGADNVLGFSSQTTGPVQYLDDGQAGFSTTGTWTSQGGGYGASSLKAATSGSPQATWTFSGLTPGSYYQLAATWPATASAYYARYSISDGNTVLTTTDISQTVAPNGFTDAGVPWNNLSLVYVTGSTLVVTLSSYYSGYPVVADAVRLQAVVGDHGLDDNFLVSNLSPTVDAGDPQSYSLAEPTFNGGRVNLGHTGNTSLAVASAAQTVQMLSPNGAEKLEVGQPTQITWRAAGLTTNQTVALMNVGSTTTQDNWLGNAYQTVSYSTSSFTNAVNTSSVVNPAPQSVYQTYATSGGTNGNGLAWQLPVADGTYSIRLHFVEPNYTSANQRKFDIQLNGSVAQSDYDIYAAAGARYKGVATSFAVTASGGQGILLELIKKASVGNGAAILSGIELLQTNAGGVASPTVNLEVSTDSGGTWTPIANNLTMDAYGRGSYLWTAGPQTAGSTALIRVTSNNGTLPQDVSDASFSIANSGQHYYVNDASTVGDFFTTAVGNNANSGKSPTAPMASLAALLDAYDLDPGDVIHVDTGNYTMLSNIQLTACDTGYASKAPAQGPAFEPQQFQCRSYAFEFQSGAKDVVLDHLSITGAYYGVYAGSTADSDGLTISNSTIYGNSQAGVYQETSSDNWQLLNNTLYGIPAPADNQTYGVYLTGSNHTLSGNTIHDSSYGIRCGRWWPDYHRQYRLQQQFLRHSLAFERVGDCGER